MSLKEQTELLTITMAAKRLGITRQGVALAITRGRLPSMKIGNVHLIRKSDLEQYKKTATRGRPKRKLNC